MSNAALEAVIREHCRELKLAAFQREYPALCRRAREGGGQPYEEFLRELLEAEVLSRHNSTARRLLREARFPDIKTLDQVDWTALKGISKPKILELTSCQFITRAETTIIAGPIGTGKTMLAIALGVEATRRRFRVLFTRAADLVLEAYSVSHGKASAYLPVIDLLKSYFEIAPEDDERKRREKIAGKVVILDRTLEDTLPYLYALLDISESDDPLAALDPQTRRRRTLEAIKRILVRESLGQPLIVEFEDLHWIDSETQALLNLLVDGIATARILLLVNYRPEYHHQWGNKTYYSQLRLDPLGREGAQELLTALMGDDESTLALKRLIIERTEGNPFFMEEMVQALFEQAVLARNGAAKLVKPLNEIRVPPTVQAILASRIDRLPAAEKELLQTLALLGREFSSGLIKRVAGKSDDELERMLSDLQLNEFIYEQPAMGDVEYTFKHALTLEVAYNSVLVERRRLLHERAGQAIEALYADRLEDHSGPSL